MGIFQIATRISSILACLLLISATQLFAATTSPGKIKTASTEVAGELVVLDIQVSVSG